MTQDLYWFGQRALRPVGVGRDFIPEPRYSKFAVGLQTRRRKMGVQEARLAPVGRSESDGDSAMS